MTGSAVRSTGCVNAKPPTATDHRSQPNHATTRAALNHGLQQTSGLTIVRTSHVKIVRRGHAKFVRA
jgi:hypothetical protein